MTIGPYRLFTKMDAEIQKNCPLERAQCSINVTNGVDPDEVARNSFDADVWRFEHIGLEPGMYNRIFIGEDDQKYAFRGFNTKAKKWPIKMIRVSDGENRVCNDRFVKEIINEYYVDAIVSDV